MKERGEKMTVTQRGTQTRNLAMALKLGTYFKCLLFNVYSRIRKPPSMSSLLIEKIFWSITNGVFTAHTEWWLGVQLHEAFTPKFSLL